MVVEGEVHVQYLLLYLIELTLRIKKYDWSREVTWRENKSSCFPPDVVFPFRVSRHNALRCITSCHSFRYNKQFIAQLVGRHEDLSHPENSCLPRASPFGRHEFSGWDKSSCLPPNWAINVYCLIDPRVILSNSMSLYYFHVPENKLI